MERLAIENESEIRCPYCLEWNMRTHDQCNSCSTPSIEATNFGAARTLFLDKKIDRNQLNDHLDTIDKSYLESWNEKYQAQVKLLQKITIELDFVEAGLKLIRSEEIEKHFLEELPLKADKFQEYRDYIPPDPDAGEILKLKYIFRSHPIKLYRGLSAIALIHKGFGDEQLYEYLTNWEPKSKYLHLERILSYSHWSMDQFTDSRNFMETKSILTLSERDGVVAGWARLYLYKGHYNRTEQSNKLVELTHTAPLQLALSCAITLGHEDKIKEILSCHINESTLPLAIQYCNETFIPGFINFLNYAPIHLHELIIGCIGGIRPKSLSYKIATLNWLLNQENADCFEAIFYWGEIPFMEQVVNHLLKTHRGLKVLEKNLCFWVENLPKNAKLPFWILEDKLFNQNRQFSPSEEVLIAKLRKRLFKNIFYQHCERVLDIPEDSGIKKLCSWLFISPALNMDTGQAYTGYSTLGQLVKRLSNKAEQRIESSEINLIENFGTGQNFLHVLEITIAKPELNEAVCEFIQALFNNLSANPAQVQEQELFLNNMATLMLEQIIKGKLKTGAKIQFLIFLESQLKYLGDNKKLSSKILECLPNCKDPDTRNRLKRIITRSKPG